MKDKVEKIELLRTALNHKGIVITNGIPEHILDVLRDNGYRVKRKQMKK